MRFGFSVFLLCISTLASAADDLSARLDAKIKASPFNRALLGLAIYDLNVIPHSLVYGLNEQQEFIPASVTKIATATAVLARLGPTFKFQTTLWSSGAIKSGVLNGDLILKGGGDPGFISESMWYLVNEFRRTGIHKINGNVVVDDTDFDAIRADESRDPERVDRAYDAPVGAMSFNWNSINIFVRPTNVGEAPSVVLDPIDNGYRLENRAKTVNKTGQSLDVSRSGNRIVVRGTIGISQPEAAIYKNIDDPAEWSGRNLVSFLEQRGVSVTGKVKLGKKPELAKLLAKSDSKPLAAAIADMMKFSNNFVAEMLTKNLAAQNGSTPASLEQGMKLVRAHVVDSGIEEKRFTLINPSGLSRRNRLRPSDLALMLVQAQKSFPWFAEFLAAFPLSGQDGTLKKRMKDSEGWVRAKTGHLSGVTALAGYAGQKDGRVRAFAFIYNGKGELDESARHLFDALATELVQ